MAEAAFENLADVIRAEVFPIVDLRLREGGHIDDLDLEEFTFLEDARPFLNLPRNSPGGYSAIDPLLVFPMNASMGRCRE